MQIARNIALSVFWTSLVGLSVYFFSENVFVYFLGYRSKTFGNSFINNQFWVIAHLVGGTIALFLGPIQFWKSIRKRYLKAHRLVGKVYISAAIIVGLSALRLSVISNCEPCRVSLFILAILVLFTTLASWYAIKNGNIKVHRQFMIRSYITIFSFVAVRIDGILPMNFLFGVIDDPEFNRTVNEYFFSFVPLIVGEILMNWIPSLQGKSTVQ